VVGEGIVREFIQHEATPDNLAAEVLRILNDEAYAMRIRKGLAEVRQRLGSPGCSQRVANMLRALLQRDQADT
jgi:lipid-A-disaccharide synthase